MAKKREIQWEANQISQYLIRQSVEEEICSRYVSACQQAEVLPLGRYELRIWKRMLSHSWFMLAYDSALAVIHPNHPLRQRIFVMLALLEVNPAYTDYFLPGPLTFGTCFRMCMESIRMAIGTACGLFLLLIRI